MTQTLDVRTGNRAIPELLIDLAWTIAGVAVLVGLGKGIAALGSALALPNACWQLLVLRAAAGAVVVGALTSAGRGSLVLFGLLYAGSLMLSHSSATVFVSVVAAGVLAAGVGRWLAGARSGLLRVYAVSAVFVLAMSAGSLYGKIQRGEGWEGVGAWGWDAVIRLSGALAALALATLVLSLAWNRSRTE